MEPYTYLSFESWNDFTSWFGGLALGYQIGFVALAIAIVIAALTLTYYVVKLALYLTYLAVKLSVFVSIFVIYSVATLFVIAPVSLIFGDKQFSEIANTYGTNVKKIATGFYGSSKMAMPATTLATSQTSIHQATQTVYVIPVVAAPQAVIYHCAACGEIFTPNMTLVLTQQKRGFCEHCGQGYTMEGNFPTPINA